MQLPTKSNFFFFLLQEVLHTISTPSGQVQRIVIFKKNGVQAMVEYPLQYLIKLSRKTMHLCLFHRKNTSELLLRVIFAWVMLHFFASKQKNIFNSVDMVTTPNEIGVKITPCFFLCK